MRDRRARAAEGPADGAPAVGAVTAAASALANAALVA
jgi:hypothetical protein